MGGLLYTKNQNHDFDTDYYTLKQTGGIDPTAPKKKKISSATATYTDKTGTHYSGDFDSILNGDILAPRKSALEPQKMTNEYTDKTGTHYNRDFNSVVNDSMSAASNQAKAITPTNVLPPVTGDIPGSNTNYTDKLGMHSNSDPTDSFNSMINSSMADASSTSAKSAAQVTDSGVNKGVGLFSTGDSGIGLVPKTKKANIINSVGVGTGGKKESWYSKNKGGIAAGIGVAAGVGEVAAGSMMNDAYDPSDAFSKINTGKMVGSTALSYASKGAAMGAASGNPFIAAAGAVGGAVVGIAQGQKLAIKAEEEQRAQRKSIYMDRRNKAKQDIANRSSMILTSRNGGKFAVAKYAFKSPDAKKLKLGGTITDDNNIIPRGVSHEEENKLGTKGMPVVSCKKDKCEKMYEIESDELILTLDATKKVEKLADKDDYKTLGKFITKQLTENTYAYSDKYKHLN